MNQPSYDWRQAATQVIKQAAAPQPTDEAIERAFLDQAFSHIESRAGKLLEEPYRLGFEIVEKRAGNTKITALFAFRIDDKLLYCPVFFLNGQIKGVELLHRHAEKRFVPFTPEWVDHLLSRSSRGTGRAVPRSGPQNRRQDRVYLERLARPDHHRKYASAEERNQEDAAAWDQLLESWRPHNAVGSPLERFLSADGNQWACEKIASWLETSGAFANLVAEHYGDPATWLDSCWPEPTPEPVTTKQASQPTGITVRRSFADGHISTPDEMALFFKRGYVVEDTRPKERLVETFDTADASQQTCTDAGVYKVMGVDGSSNLQLVCREGDNIVTSADPRYGCSSRDTETQYRLIDLSGQRGTERTGTAPFGTHVKDLRQALQDGDLKERPEAGGAWSVIDIRSGTASEPIWVSECGKRGALDTITVQRSYYTDQQLVINPKAPTNYQEGVLGRDICFAKVDATRETFDLNSPSAGPRIDIQSLSVSPGTPAQVTGWLLRDHAVKEASVRRCPTTGQFEIVMGGRLDGRGLSRPAALVKMAAGWGICSEAADQMLDQAEQDGRARRLVWAGELEKAAGIIPQDQIIFPDEEFQQQGFDSTFNVPVEYPQMVNAVVDRDHPERDVHRVGDGWDPRLQGGEPTDNYSSWDDEGGDEREGWRQDSMPDLDLFNSTPEQLAELHKQHAIPQVFDHGVIGSLVKTHNASSQVSSYLPHLEEALDAIGRIIFLFYWKPADFEQDYGTDDMQNLESELLSQFQSLGELTLGLLKKAKRREEGISTFANMSM